jgi:acetyl-CoA acyltransferase
MVSAVIVDAVRTASGRGKPGGALSGVHPITLLAATLRGLIGRSDLDPALVDDVIGGCVTQFGDQAINITRSAWLAAGFPETVPATTVDRQCGSSQQAASFAAQGVLAGAYDIAIACGVESMSRVPMSASVPDGDPWQEPLRDRIPGGLVPLGISAELVAAQWGLGRPELDEYAASSQQRAARTAAAGGFDDEIIPVAVTGPGGEPRVHRADETIRPDTTAAGLAALRPAFASPAYQDRFPQIGWRITAGNSSPLTDGAAAVLIMSEEAAARLDLRPRARFHEFAVVGSDPVLTLSGPIPATRKVLSHAKLSLDDIDACEVNEAFAAVPLAWARELHADPERLNPRGGAIALGHPLGASGARLITTLVSHLGATGGRYGLVTMCERGGTANATIIERL